MASPEKVDIWFPTNIGEFFSLTAGMTGHEVGAFQLIIANLWKNGGAIKADDRQLAKLVKATPKQWGDIKETLWPLFEIRAGFLVHPPTSAEIAKAIENREKRRAAGIASGISRRGASVQQNANTCSTEAEPRADRGGDVGVSNQSQEEGIEGKTHTREGRFTVVDGGAK